MTFGAILVLAVGLAMDATAVAAARGMAVSAIRPRHLLLVAAFFGGFQALMPAIGWLVGSRIGGIVQAWDHWIAFVLLGAIGAKMLWEARGAVEPASRGRDARLFSAGELVVLALATSVDALAAGITLPILHAPFVLSLLTIGLTTAALSALGLLLGRRFGAVLGRRLDVLGGVVLIGLGAKILIEHVCA